MLHLLWTVGIVLFDRKEGTGLGKGNGHAESRQQHKIFEVSIPGDKRCMMIQTALSDEGIGQIGSAAVAE